MTAQLHEHLILNGEETSMAFCPLLPEMDPRIVDLIDDEIDRHSIIFSTACWRQYVETWEIKDNKLYLVNLDGRFKLAAKTPVFADWYTGTLKIPQGEMLEYVHMGYGSVYEREAQIKIEKGVVSDSKTIHNTRTPGTQYTPLARPLKFPYLIYMTSIEAGFPSPAEDYIEGSLDLNQKLIKHLVAPLSGLAGSP